MKPKKLLLLILLILFGIGVAFCGLLYYTIKTKEKDVSNQEPFVSIIDKEILLGQDAILVNNYEFFVFEEPLYLDAVGSNLYEGTTIAHHLKKGDVLVIHSVKDFINGVSGTSSTLLFGNVTTGNPKETIPFEYNWATQSVEEDESGVYIFKFELAEWEKEH